jgi:tetratricopeptide (TPR) repeat protein
MQVERSNQRENVLINSVILQFRRWKEHLFRLYVVLPVCVGLVILAFKLPSLIGAGYMMLGNQALETGEAYVAVQYLQQARTWSPTSPGVYRSLAQAYLLLDKPTLSVAALEDAYRLQPDSLLIQQELAQAYEAYGEDEVAGDIWDSLGLTAARMANLGDQWFSIGQYDTAGEWYRRALSRDPSIGSRIALQQALVEVVSGSHDISAHAFSDLTVFTMGSDGEIFIPGTELRWLTSIPEYTIHIGTPLSHGHNRSAGVMWWSGRAGTVFEVEEAGRYTIFVRAMHDRPAPVAIALIINTAPVATFNLDRADGSWETVATRVNLDASQHLIALQFLNNAVVNDEDRDLVIDWIQIR